MKKLLWASLSALALLLVIPTVSHAQSFGFLEKSVNRTYVPLRYISEELGNSVQWNQTTKAVTISQSSSSLTLTVGSSSAVANGSTITIDAPPVLYNGITYVPIRVISDTLSIPIKWVQEKQEVHIQKGTSTLVLPVWDKSYATRPPMTHQTRNFTVFDKLVRAEVVKVDLLHPNIDVKAVWAKNQKGSVDSVQNIAKHFNATIAINASYFNATTSSSTYGIPYGDFINNGVLENVGGTDQGSIYFAHDGSVKILPGGELRSFHKANPSVIQSSVQAGPRLVNNNVVNIDPLGEGFKDPRILTANAERSAIGMTNDHQLLIVATSNMTLAETAILMNKLGAIHALNLDGGGSSGLYYKGKYVANPGRMVSNAIVVTY